MSGLQMHPVTAELLAKAHRADLQADARYARLAREAREAGGTRSTTPHLTLLKPSIVTRRRVMETLIATALALGVIAGSAGAQATPAHSAPAAAAAAPAQFPASGGGIHLHR